MRTKDLTGMEFGTLKVIAFDEERHKMDKQLFQEGKINRVRRYYLCECLLCGNIISVRGENLVSGNTKGCGCDRNSKISEKLKKENCIIYDCDKKSYVLFASNTNNEFLISGSDYFTVAEHCWYETDYGYLMTRINKDKQILLHRYLMFGENDSEYEDILVDHRSKVRSDNRRTNLRICNDSENARNISTPSTNTSGHIGVSYYEPTNKWRAYVTVDRKFISLGYYDKFEDAVQARLDGEKKYYGEFAPSIN